MTPRATTDLDRLCTRFRGAFAGNPAFVVTAPGRVNLIGEHIDYVGLPVMPVAIDRRITLLIRPRDDGAVRLVSLQDDTERQFAISGEIAPGPAGDWGNYPRAAAQALAHHAGGLRGVDALVASDLPAAAGLSSSSALVVAVGLALVEASDLAIDRPALARLLADGERYVGTMGGAMDQTVCLMARHGHAARIDFEPPGVTYLPVPEDWTFIVADSLERAEKSGAAQETYNARTREVEAARQGVADALGIGDASYRELTEGYATGDLLAAARRVLDRTLFRRFRHVVTEADRVVDAETALCRGDLVAFGGVLDNGHASLREDYDVSTDRLDHLTALAVDAGATGARLTGAGLGGSALIACEAGRGPGIIAALERGFYARLGSRTPPEDRIFTVEPSGAAAVSRL